MCNHAHVIVIVIKTIDFTSNHGWAYWMPENSKLRGKILEQACELAKLQALLDINWEQTGAHKSKAQGETSASSQATGKP